MSSSVIDDGSQAVAQRCSVREPYDFGSIIPGACLIDIDTREWVLSTQATERGTQGGQP